VTTLITAAKETSRRKEETTSEKETENFLCFLLGFSLETIF